MQAVTEPSGVSPETFKVEISGDPFTAAARCSVGTLLRFGLYPLYGASQKLHSAGLVNHWDDLCYSYVCLLAAEPDFTSTDIFPSFRLYEVRRLSTATMTMSRLAPYGEDVLVQELNSYMLVWFKRKLFPESWGEFVLTG
ncbi:hypothetical protein DY000_02036269 [Brassica cretica]|uniref:Uncharacterized protein n=1 Tax=Brassica cretica TaxID=69181 RepID=A0ABQ7BAT7_BRACR|nr:hypothetical protein DY000_02036269 [Brassica cretica]